MSLNITAHKPAPAVQPSSASGFHPAFVTAWFFCLIFYFLQYAVRSAPSVMIPELTAAFGLTTLGMSSLLGLYYYTYSTFALLAGASLDRWGAKYTIPIGVLFLAIGIVMFGLGISWMASFGRLLQGAGAAFAFTGAVYLAAHGFPAKWLATAVGFTQCMGMLGGSAGQFAVGPLVHGVIGWQSFWIYAGLAAFVIALAMLIVTPRREDRTRPGSVLTMFAPYRIVLTNPQSYLCGLCSGLLFLPTTIGAMIFGVSFLSAGWHLGHDEAVYRASMIALGWVFGAPILGYVADHFGRRKPVLFGGIAIMLVALSLILYMPPDSLPPYAMGFILGFGSGAAMIPYSIIKEVNPDEVKGSATGAINFLVFTMSAFGAPLAGWVLQRLAGGAPLSLPVFQMGGAIAIAGIVAAAILAAFLRETGWAANQA